MAYKLVAAASALGPRPSKDASDRFASIGNPKLWCGHGGGRVDVVVTPVLTPHTRRHTNRTHRTIDRELLMTGSGQVAFHHAGICADDRACVERLFGQGQVRVLCSTSTLAVGINTPAHLVVIKGTPRGCGRKDEVTHTQLASG